MNFWDNKYRTSPEWDIGYPQPEFEELMKRSEMKPGRLLDIGCGTGENAIYFAKKGFSVFGIDVVRRAINSAILKANDQNVNVKFLVKNILDKQLKFEMGKFDNIIDSGLFHAMTDQERPIFANQIWNLLRIKGTYFMLCFSDKEPPGDGPRRITKLEIKQTFSPLLKINYIKAASFVAKGNITIFKAYLASISKMK
jgi:cyclopropane fatty-acyl-phospholipid synthase-like methyltransferase